MSRRPSLWKKLRTGLTPFLALMLVLMPSGGSVCWPLLEGRHLHIGWNTPTGESALTLTTFTHAKSQPVGYSATVALQPTSPAELPLPGDLLATVVNRLELPAVTLCWLWLTRLLTQRLPGFPLQTPPPRNPQTFSLAAA